MASPTVFWFEVIIFKIMFINKSKIQVHLFMEIIAFKAESVGEATCLEFLNFMPLFITGNVVACFGKIKALKHI